MLYDSNHFNAFVRSFEQRRPTNYKLELTTTHPIKVLNGNHKVVSLGNYNVCESAIAHEGRLFLPKDVETLGVQFCFDISNLCELASFENVTSLKNCTISRCDKMTHLFPYWSRAFPFIQSLENLNLDHLQDLRGLISGERGSPLTLSLPPIIFSSLKKLCITSCFNIKKLFVIASLPNLEVLLLKNCLRLMEISATSNDNEDPSEEGKESVIVDTLELSKLVTLELQDLPKLQSVAILADSLQSVVIMSVQS